MKNLDINIVLVRVNKIQEYLKRLRRYESITLEDFLQDVDIQLIAEHLIQLMTEAALDINKYLLSQLGVLQKRDNWTNKEYFLETAKHNILTSELATKLAEAAGMRNILVHLYLEIDPRKVFIGIQTSLKYYPLYLRQISNYLKSLNIE
ncbi:DUF86 domain-containing protein [Spirulina sp. CS-785/01]|uniref:type VII toxin-antitoxin system HepT family RNase toxin n=1 Tax=Spirulina sp. CS-785/01 TaxID=3021716 RepID=UPI00232ECD60|nr:DUF86 domain-containing protein [Spirulina sp. CS-785/01]MDB9316006.1 DUF86 domain-containing protein [Spirulina sp. CS-785/01]